MTDNETTDTTTSTTELPSEGRPAPTTRGGGFADMDPEVRREIGRRGGKAAHAAGKAHQFTSDEARAAALKGVATRAAKRRAAAG
jgi:general stress protein YciG